MWFAALALAIALVEGIRLLPLQSSRPRAWRYFVPALALIFVALLALKRIEVSKLVGLLLLPAGLVWLALALGLGTLIRLKRWKLIPAAAAVFFLYTLAGNAWVGGLLVRSLELGVKPDPDAAPYDAVFVLGGGTGVAADGRPQLTGAGDRLRYAAHLFHAGRTRVLVASGHSITALEPPRDLAVDSRMLWADMGVPTSAVVTIDDPGTVNTAAEIAAYRELIQRFHWKRVGLVTSAWHMPRAQRLCRRAGLTMAPLPADWRGGVPGLAPLWLVPQAGGFDGVQIALWEYLGSLRDR